MWVGLALVLVIAVVAIALYVGARASRQEPLHIDLRASSMYVKKGFDTQSIGRDPAQAGDWAAVIPAGASQSLLAKDVVPATGGRSFLDPRRDKDEDFTYATSFWMDAATLETITRTPSIIPCISLAGIGEGWEVYLNGRLVTGELYRDGDGTITRHRAWRSAALILDRDLLVEGSNQLTFHIVGPALGDYTGLFYRTPYYIGNYQDISYSSDRLLAVVFCTVFIFMGLYHLLLFFMRRKDRYNLFYGLFSVFMGLYFLVRSPSVYLLVADTSVTRPLEYSLLYVLTFFMLAFVEVLNNNRMLWLTRIYGIFCVAAVAATMAFSLQFADNLLAIWQYLAMLLLLYLIGYDIVFVFFRTAYRTWRDKDGPQGTLSLAHRIRLDLAQTALGNLLVVFLVAGATMLYDVIDAAFLHTGVLLSRYSFVFLTVCAAFILARQLTSNYERANVTNERLESLVQERTHELAEQVVIANQASQAKTEFMATMSHEIRTPMNAIIGLSNIELRRDHPEPTQANLQKINRSGISLLALINEILDISKIEAGSFEVIPVRYRTVDPISESVQLNLVRIGEKPITFELEVDAALPSALNGDEIRIRQVLNNLLSNAVKYTASGTVRLTVTVEPMPAGGLVAGDHEGDKVGTVGTGSAAGGGDRGGDACGTDNIGTGTDACDADGDAQAVLLVVRVADTGQGIREEDRERLFEVFTQFDSRANRTIEGTGLGLAITKRLLDLMGGSIEVQSEHGVGSTFSIRLPQQVVDPTPIGAELSARLAELRFDTGPQGPHEHVGRVVLSPQTNILVVDDVPTNLEVAQGLLEPYGVNVDCVSRGALAVEAIREGATHYDLVFMDHMMPEMDGVEATRIIRNEIDSDYARQVPIVALTANATTGAAEMFLANGFDAFISKPIDLRSLDDVLGRLIGESPPAP
ncbi:MAG: response regulator [Coriobacteriales bacterium]|nr:response regulator [Coriobacteriales bacterium]